MVSVKVVTGRNEAIAALNTPAFDIVAYQGVILTESDVYFFCCVIVPNGNIFNEIIDQTNWHLIERKHEKKLPSLWRRLVARDLVWIEVEEQLRAIFPDLRVELPAAI